MSKKNLTTLASRAVGSLRRSLVAPPTAISAGTLPTTREISSRAIKLPTTNDRSPRATSQLPTATDAKFYDVGKIQSPQPKPTQSAEDSFAETLDLLSASLANPFSQKPASTTKHNVLGKRHYSTSIEYTSIRDSLKQFYPFYENLPNEKDDPAISAYNQMASELSGKIFMLNDGVHTVLDADGKLANRALVISRYHEAILNAYKKFLTTDIKPDKIIDEIDITCIDSVAEKAKGTFVIAKTNKEEVARMFIADNSSLHLTNLSIFDFKLRKMGVDPVDFAQKMLLTYFERKIDRETEEEKGSTISSYARRSCADFGFKHYITAIAKKNGSTEKNPMFKSYCDEDGYEITELNMMFTVKDLLKVLKKGLSIKPVETTALKSTEISKEH